MKTTALGLHPPSSVGGLGCFREILEADNQAPKKQKHTAKRIFERLKADGLPHDSWAREMESMLSPEES